MGLGGESPGNGADGFGGGGGSGGGKDYFVDTKLLFRLKQFVTEQRERSKAPVTEDSAMNYLLGRFKEYVRKPQVPGMEREMLVWNIIKGIWKSRCVYDWKL